MARRRQRRGASPRRRSAPAGRAPWSSGWHPVAYALAHLRAFFYSLGRLAEEPLATVLMVSIIAIAMALPIGLHLVIRNIEGLSASWQGSKAISVFVDAGLGAGRLEDIRSRLRELVEAERLDYLTPDQALSEFREHAGPDIDTALDILGENPLPGVFVIEPVGELPGDRHGLEALVRRIEAVDGVTGVQLDRRWVQRMQAVTALGRRVTVVLTALFSLAVLLAIGNSIRIEVQIHSDEIAVEKLVGATDAFIRRPFLYTGAWLGLLGAAVSIGLVKAAGLYWQAPLEALWRLSESAAPLRGLDPGMVAEVLAIGVLLGIGGGWLAVLRQLRKIDPV